MGLHGPRDRVAPQTANELIDVQDFSVAAESLPATQRGNFEVQ